MKKGVLYGITDWTIDKLTWLNLVEYFKLAAKKIHPKQTLTASRIGVDIFILLKWIAVILLWINGINNDLINILIWYLIGTNIFTYFYYHTWTKDLDKGHFDLDRVKRRFFNLMLAISFNVFCFAYLFALPFSKEFQWSNEAGRTMDAVLYSVANSLTVDYELIKPITQTAQTLSLIETITMFVFLTIILSNSIPQFKSD